MENSGFASDDAYDQAIREAKERLHAANQPDGDPQDRPRAWDELQRAQRAKEANALTRSGRSKRMPQRGRSGWLNSG